MIKYIALFFTIIFFQSASAVNFGWKTYTINSDQKVQLEIPPHEKGYLILVKNSDVDTFAEIQDSNQIYKVASWMAVHGYYYLLAKQNQHKHTISIKVLENIIGTKAIEIAIFKIEDVTIEQAVEKHMNASHLRFTEYLGGENKKELAFKLFSTAHDTLSQQQEYLLAAVSAYEAAETLRSLYRYDEALNYYKKAKKHWSTGPYLFQKIKTINQMGLTHWRANHLDHAIAAYSDMLSLLEKTNETTLIARAYSNIGLINWEKKNILEAQKNYFHSLKLYGIESPGEKNLNELLELIKRTNNIKNVAATINNLAYTYDSLGSSDVAEKLWSVYLAASQLQSDLSSQYKAKTNLASIYLRQGMLEKSKRFLDEAIDFFQKKEMKRWLSLALQNLGQYYLDLGMLRDAEIALNESLEIKLSLDNPKEVAAVLTKLISIYIVRKEVKQARKAILQVLDLKHELDFQTLALTYYNLADLEFNENRYTKSRKVYEEHINPVLDSLSVRLKSKFLLLKSQLELIDDEKLNEVTVLLDKIKNSLTNYSWDINLLNNTINTLAFTYHKNKQPEKSIQIISKEIGNLNFYINQTNNTKIKSRLYKKLKETLRVHAFISNKNGLPQEGFNKTNKHLINAYSQRQSKGKEDNFTELILELENKSFALEEHSLSPKDRFKIENDLLTLKTKLDFSYQSRTEDKPSVFNLESLQKRLKKNTVLVQFSISKYGGVSWWITKDSFFSYELPKKSDLLSLVRQSRKELQQNNLNLSKSIMLSESLLAPLKSYDEISNVILILDEPLNLVPFSALGDPRYDYKKLLINTSELNINVLITNGAGKNSNNSKYLFFADPVTINTDSRLTKLHTKDEFGQSFPRLKGSSREYQQARKVTDSSVFSGFDANKKAFSKYDLTRIKALHFATHAFFNSEIPDFSALVLSAYKEDGTRQPAFLRAYEIRNMDLSNIDLVVLSGCETGVSGVDDSYGLGGLSQSFLDAGAKQLVSSLWKVDDHTTTYLMTEFYKAYSEGHSASKALSLAQAVIRENPRTRHPKYWAGWFVISR